MDYNSAPVWNLLMLFHEKEQELTHAIFHICLQPSHAMLLQYEKETKKISRKLIFINMKVYNCVLFKNLRYK